MQIPRDLAVDGPIAWLRHFETSPAFSMAVDGRVILPGADSATAYLRALSRTVSAIDLEWTDLRVEPLAPGIAAVAAAYRESVTDTVGSSVAFAGYMTGVARHTSNGWRLQHLHWSSPVPPAH
jgi:hypothetical protein